MPLWHSLLGIARGPGRDVGNQSGSAAAFRNRPDEPEAFRVHKNDDEAKHHEGI